MIRNIQDVETFLAKLPTGQRDYSERLEVVRESLQKLHNPQDSIPAIHIAGTSGKGSTAYYAAHMLRASGYKVGLAVSPHVNSVTERSQINGAPLPDSQYCDYFNRFRVLISSLEGTLSYIEFLTIFTYWLFAQLKLDYIVIEVGLGGRLDATNTISRPDTIRVITDIGYDHTELLGHTLSAITREKAGIIHASNLVIMHPQAIEVMEVVQKTAAQLHAVVITVDDDRVPSSTRPRFQQRNITLAWAAVTQRLTVDHRPSPPRATMQAALSLRIPGRFEVMTRRAVTVVLDVAHNPQKMTALADGIRSTFPGTQAIYVVALGYNKRSSAIASLNTLRATAHSIIMTTFTADTDVERGSIPPADMMQFAYDAGFESSQVKSIANPYEALALACATAIESDSIVVVTGSFYLIDGVRRALLLEDPEYS